VSAYQLGGVCVLIRGCPHINNWGVSAYQLGGVRVSIRGCLFTAVLIILGRASCIKKETLSQLGILKKNIIRQKKDLRDIFTNTL
jgi:hypothetical protein